MEGKRQRNAEQSRKDILHAAEQQFGEKGFYGARVDEIAKQSGLNKHMLYIYFESKEELYRCVLKEIYRRMEDVEKCVLAKELLGKELINALISAYFDFLKDNETFVNILMSENLMHAQFMKQLPSECIERKTLNEIADRIRESCNQGEFRSDLDERQFVLTMITICFSNFSNRYTLSRMMGFDLYDPEIHEKRKQQAIDILLSYLTRKDHLPLI